MAKTLYLLRHGSTGQNGRFIGSTDLPVTPSGFEQIAETRMLLQHLGISTLYCSPMLRCRQTADHLGLGLEREECSSLKEIDFGFWEQKTFDEIAAKWPKEVQEWANWSEAFTFPGGENTGNFLKRVQAAREIIDNSREERVLVVAHGGVIRQLICLYLGISSDKYLLFDIKAGCYSTLSLFSDGGILTSLNSGWK
jgi:broad specificity phosphatase PhoE